MENTINYKEGRVLLDFHAAWCGPCRAMEPMVEQFAEEAADYVKLIKVDVDAQESAEVASVFGIRSIPCFIYLEDGEQITKGIGTKTLEQLKEMCGL